MGRGCLRDCARRLQADLVDLRYVTQARGCGAQGRGVRSNGKPGVSEATREAVLTALDVLGYERPTKLRGERGRLVGLVLPELQNPIFPALAEVVTASLAQR